MTTTITTDPGTIAVPMSSILDALEGVLSEEERAALFSQLIGLRPGGVAPGDLITAELFNQVLSDINDLAARVALLEGASDTTPRLPVITQIVPGIVRTGHEFVAIGENLHANLLSRIDVEDTNIPLDRIKTGSSPTRLVLDAPAIIGLPGSGATVVLSVSNAAGTGQAPYFQLPGIAAEIQANATFILTSVTPDEAIEANSDYDYSFEINIHSSHDETFTLVPEISGTGFTASVDGSASIAVTSASATEGFTVTKVISVHTGASGSGDLVLNLNGTEFPSFAASSQSTAVTIEDVPVIPTDEIIYGNPLPIGPNARFVNNELLVRRQPSGAPGNIILSVPVTLKTSGSSYAVTSPAAGPVGQWSALRTSSGTITTNTPNASSNVMLTVTPANNGSQYTAADGTLSFTISLVDGDAEAPFSATLRVVDTLPA